MTLWDEVRRLQATRARRSSSPRSTSRRPTSSPTASGSSATGRIVAEGTPAALKAEVGRPHLDLTLRRRARDLDRAREVLARFGDLRPPAEGCHVSSRSRAARAPIAPVVRALDEAGLLVASLELVQPTLDDVFVEKTGQPPRGRRDARARTRRPSRMRRDARPLALARRALRNAAAPPAVPRAAGRLPLAAAGHQHRRPAPHDRPAGLPARPRLPRLPAGRRR